jgi:hypothetical protein
MPRTARASQANWIYHVLNRGNARSEVFHKGGDYDRFVALLSHSLEKVIRKGVRKSGTFVFALSASPFSLPTARFVESGDASSSARARDALGPGAADSGLGLARVLDIVNTAGKGVAESQALTPGLKPCACPGTRTRLRRYFNR